VYTDLIGTRKGLTWKQVKELSENGFDIQSHTKTHRNLVQMQKSETFEKYFRAIAKEISTAETLIEKKLNKKCAYIAYPYGDTNNLVIALLRKYGYRGAFTVHRGSNPFFMNNYMVNRSTIYGEYSLEKFQKNLAMFGKENLQ
jgi:peptidoglycan/xylan/chitin deacetylase (PgdA/CDA1 family)